jgi:RNA polymerase sigma-70 factor, ECF subfamily
MRLPSRPSRASTIHVNDYRLKRSQRASRVTKYVKTAVNLTHPITILHQNSTRSTFSDYSRQLKTPPQRGVKPFRTEGCLSDFHLLLQEQIPQLMRYASALTRDADEAVDLVEDMVREALAHPRQCAGNIRVGLLTILHDLRGNPFRQMTLGIPETRDPAAKLTLSDLDRALGQLPEEQRAIILLIGLERLSYADAGATLRISPTTLRSRLSHARAELGRLMGVENTARTARAA